MAAAVEEYVRRFLFAFLLPVCMMPLQSATLERLSLPDMITKASAIVRGTVLDSYSAFSGPVIYTHYHIQVTEQLKGSVAGTVDVAVPGGIAKGVLQNYAGAPEFSNGEDYVFFLWASKSGMNLILGLTQGLFSVSSVSASQTGGQNPNLTRRASHELMLDPVTHQQVKDRTLTMSLSDLRAQIAAAQGSGK
jgi:hypothetical protein